MQNFAKSRDEELEIETEILRDRDVTSDLWDRDSNKLVSRHVSRPRPSLETPSQVLRLRLKNVLVMLSVM